MCVGDRDTRVCVEGCGGGEEERERARKRREDPLFDGRARARLPTRWALGRRKFGLKRFRMLPLTSTTLHTRHANAHSHGSRDSDALHRRCDDVARPAAVLAYAAAGHAAPRCWQPSVWRWGSRGRMLAHREPPQSSQHLPLHLVHSNTLILDKGRTQHTLRN